MGSSGSSELSEPLGGWHLALRRDGDNCDLVGDFDHVLARLVTQDEVRVLVCRSHCSSPALAVLFLTSCRSALFTRCGSVLLASCPLDHPTLSLLTSRNNLSALLRTCLTFSSVCLSVFLPVTPCATFSWTLQTCCA